MTAVTVSRAWRRLAETVACPGLCLARITPRRFQGPHGGAGLVLTLAAAVCLGGLAVKLHPTAVLDRAYSDLALAGQAIAMPADVKVITISAGDLARRDLLRIDRIELAGVLEQMADARAARVLIDLSLTNAISPREAASLERALARLGPDRVALGFEPDPAIAPPSGLRGRATPVDLRLAPDRDGRIRAIVNPERRVSPDGSGGFAPALWLASGARGAGPTPIDLRYDPSSVRRLSYADLARADAPTPHLAGALVVISGSRLLIGGSGDLPGAGETDRGTLLAMAAASARSGFARAAVLCEWLSVIASWASLAAGLLIGALARRFRTAACALGLAGLAGAGIAVWTTQAIGGPATPGLSLVLLQIGFWIALAHRLRVGAVLSAFMKGDLSPEEVWLWQVHGEQSLPVVLFGPGGAIKRANGPAVQRLLGGKTICTAAARDLASACFPTLGERATRIGEDRSRRVYDISWAHPSTPVALFVDVTERVREETELARRLITDPLTGACNRTGFEQALNAVAASGRTDWAVFYLDMNGFKAINDLHGHDAGDQLLRAAAGRFRSVLRERDMLSRLGGDEFAILIANPLDHDIAAALARKLERELESPVRLDCGLVTVGVAVGYALPEFAGEPGSAVVARADAAMYARKAETRRAA
jgi:diguanylate cyclase (GGDEF)-like protein